MFGKIFKLSLSVMLAAVVTGCSFLAPSTQVITVNGQPAGAIVTVNGNTMAAPAQFTVKPNRPISITVSKEGYLPTVISTSSFLSQYGMLDLVGGFFFLLPWIGLLAPGAFSLDNQNFNYYLVPAK